MEIVAPPLPPKEADLSFLGVIAEACNGEAARAAGWRAETGHEPSPRWIHVLNGHAAPPEQGWKLHLSAAVASAEDVLRRALPVLLAEDAPFKVAASIRTLGHLNSGAGGFSQVGKFITVYPNSDAQAVRLAAALDEATRGLRGPAIPSDRPLAPGSLVHYRYGGFDDRHVQLPFGQVFPAIRKPDGELVPDQRLTAYYAPSWAADPFLAAGVAAASERSNPLIGQRYLIVSTLQNTPRGSIHVAVDIEDPRRCILKKAHRDAFLGSDGRDARDRLRHEAEVLARLAPDVRFPTPFGLIEEGDALFLAMEEVEGDTMEQHVRQLLLQGRFLPGEQVAAWGQELAMALGTIHEKGFLYRDMKSPNVIVTSEGRLRLLDFETAHERTASTPPATFGTRGYQSPQQEAGHPPTVTDDVYGLGALLYFMATGVEPSHAPRPFALLDRPIRAVNPAIGPGLASAIARCLDPDPARRFSSMKALASALAAADAEAPAPPAPFGAEPLHEPEEAARHRYRDLARRLGDTLCQAARRPPGGQGMTWTSAHPVAGPGSRDLNTGSAGTVLALAELTSELRPPEYAEVLAEGARYLAASAPMGGSFLPGLYVGEAGVGAALLRAGQVLAREDLTEAALERGRQIAAMPHASQDLFNGTAGRLRFHLWLWDETAEAEPLRHALQAGEALLSSAEDAGDGGLRWTIPPGYNDLSGRAYLGYAHGGAGIADALLDLFEATGEERFLTVAQGAGRWLRRLAVPVLDGGEGLGWPALEGEATAGALWCHGATGVGRFFLHLASTGTSPEAADLAARAGRAVARGARAIGPTQCHGLAGNAEFLLDLFQATGERTYLSEAYALARLLEAFGIEQEGRLMWPSESPVTFSPDYMVGYAGVAVCLLRLSAPERLPHQLSRRGFQPTLKKHEVLA